MCSIKLLTKRIFLIFIFWELTELYHFVTYLWNDPRISSFGNILVFYMSKPSRLPISYLSSAQEIKKIFNAKQLDESAHRALTEQSVEYVCTKCYDLAYDTDWMSRLVSNLKNRHIHIGCTRKRPVYDKLMQFNAEEVDSMAKIKHQCWQTRT